MSVFIGGVGATKKKKSLTLYRTKGLDSKGKKFYNTQKNLFGDVYYIDKKNRIYKYDLDSEGNEYGIPIRKSMYNITYK